VIAALASDQTGARALAAQLLPGERNLQRGVHRLRAGVAEEHVIEVGRRQRGDAARKLERRRITELERRHIVDDRRLVLDRGRDRLAPVTGVGAPHAGRSVDQLAAVGCEVVHVLGAGEHARRLLEGAVRGERHPESGEIVRDGGGGADITLDVHFLKPRFFERNSIS
jgi:hypothetical protein